jgi:hypothetical protein
MGAFFVMIATSALLIFQLQGEMWTLAGTVVWVVYLLALLLRAVMAASLRHLPPLAMLILWMLAPLSMVIAPYAGPGGWALWSRALALLCAIVLTGYAPPNVRQSGLLLAMVSLSLALLGTYTVDRGVGLVAGDRKPGGLVLPRLSTVSYDTPEFSHRVQVNRYGFRGMAADLDAAHDCRVVLLGDSFTYGWGVDYEQTWGAILERDLRAGGTDAQVLNLGVPGTGTADYAVIAAQALPLLDADVVLVGVLQGDDMRQVTREPGVFPRSLSFGEQVQPSPLTEYVTFHYPFLAERTLLRSLSAGEVRRAWASTAAAFRRDFSEAEAQRYAAIPTQIRDDFEAGQINPHFVALAVTAPDYWNWPTQPPETLTPYIDMMAGHLGAVANAAGDATVLAVSVPHGAYTQRGAWEALRTLGFTVPAEALASTLVDLAIEAAATEAGVGFLAVTDAFRAADDPAFYPVDGHFNAYGNMLLARELLPDVQRACHLATTK